ncbi:hypothetical protein SAMN05444340_107165 [Citreimonas salinaria]|uniref:Arginine transporter n=2 Tax=Citreimonas salinaria TaxID=321339 RepID=A0A1H3JQD7_9RHOB|nr:hypothetical protein SAMN05444340_107165 [Citreimonas salinaria]
MLAACGGGRSNEMPTRAAFANGPIQVACQTGGRSEANPALCRCIQFVANQSLSGGDQRMAVDFFKDPHRAQEIRQSDNPRHEEFWKRYRSFADASEGLCSPYR